MRSTSLGLSGLHPSAGLLVYATALGLILASCASPSGSAAGGGVLVSDAVTDTGSADASTTADTSDVDTASGSASDGASGDTGSDTGGSDGVGGDGAPSDASCSVGQPCDDGDLCTQADGCVGGVCKGTPLDCNIGLGPCSQGACEPSLGVCVTSNKDAACDDGDPCTAPDNCLLGACTGFPVEGCCTPSCAGKVCGDNGCGASCGSCASGQICGAGTCVTSSKAGETCGDALKVGELPFKHFGTTSGANNDLSAPDNACYASSLGLYGAEVVYAYTAGQAVTLALTLSGYDNKPSLYVATDCADIKNSCLSGALGFGQSTLGPSYAAVAKGQTAFIIVDADGAGGDFTLEVKKCTPNCQGKVCGTDGCGGTCGDCPLLSAYNCSSVGTCLCVPNCYEKTCGSDGCGGACGKACGDGQSCDGVTMAGQFTGSCVKAGQAGDTCSSAVEVTGSPFVHNGSTVGLGNDLYGWAFCEGNGAGAYLGDEAPDKVFRIAGDKAATYLVELKEQSTNLQLYALTDCAKPMSCLQTSYKAQTLKSQLLVEASAARPVFVAVDGYSKQSGTFLLEAKRCDKPADCPTATPGDTCTWPVEVKELPYNASGSLGLPGYALPKGACGAPKTLGDAAANTAYRLVASASGTYTVKVTGTGGMDPIVYVAKDCLALSASCLGYADKTGDKGVEVLAIAAKAGDVLHIIVDATSNVGGTFSIAITGP